VDNIAKLAGSCTLIAYGMSTPSGEADESESLALLRPLFRNYRCRLVFFKPDYILCVFDDEVALKECLDTLGGGIRNKFHLRRPQ
jgi:hypothetical protein